MSQCKSCGREVPESGRFCPSCGAPLGSNPPFPPSDATAPMPSPRSAGRASSSQRAPSSGLSSEGRFLPGTLLAERYRIVALLGQGGMGEVYRADDLTLGQPVALKFLPEHLARDEDSRDRFREEVRIARKVSHSNVCRVYDLGEAEGLTFLSMEYVDGEDLASLLRRIGRLPEDKGLEIARQLCAGLAAAHREGVLHRDLKPANVMLDGRGRAVMTDFGLAGLAEQIPGHDVRSGTPAYMAPEQLEGREVSVRSDIYSLGLVLYEIFAGKPAFTAGSMEEMARSRRENVPSSPAQFVKDLDPAVERVILRCLDPDPQSRPASALAVAAALPGGDPLAAALAAGETPTPQMVAAAGGTAGMAPRPAMWNLAAVVLGSALLVFVGHRENGLGRIHPENPPAALEQTAREITTRLGYSPGAADHGSGFTYDYDYLEFLGKGEQTRAAWDEVFSARPSLLCYWYRTSPRPMVPTDFNNMALAPGALTFDDPPPVVSGMINLRLDPQGRLTYWQAMPPQMEPLPPYTGPTDWSPLFAAAGLDPAQFKPADPAWSSLAAYDTRAAWTGTWPGSSRPLRVEAAAWRGKPVFFSLVGSWSRPGRMQQSSASAGEKFNEIISVILYVSVLVTAVLLARRNLRRGKGDVRGAFRLAGAVFLIEMAYWLCAGHLVTAAVALVQLIQTIGASLFVAGSIWVMYLALEPYVRRHWPQTIISWSRLLSGRLRDPLVGRDVLAGVALGVAWSLIFTTGYLLQMRLGSRPQFGATEYLLGLRAGLGVWVGNIVESILGTLMFFFILFLLRVLLRNRMLAALAFVALFTARNSVGSEHPLIAIPVWLAIYGIAAFAVVRFGLIVLATAVFSANILMNLPVTLDFSAWYAGASLTMVLSFVVLAGCGLYNAFGGQKPWKDGLFD